MGQICSCGNPKFGNLGRPNCIIEMKAIAFPIIIPRFDSNGDRNVINVMSATLGQDIQDMIEASNPSVDRIYPFPRCENVTEDRTETTYEVAASGRKYKIEGVGEVRSWNFELWGKDAAHQILRELKKYGCSEVDFFLVDIAGSMWGIKDDINGTEMRGYEMSTETFNAFKRYATDTTTQKIMIMWDVDNGECEENSYAVTAEESVATGGVKLTSLRGLQTAYQTLTELNSTTIQTEIWTGFGSASDRDDVVGLAPGGVSTAFTVNVNGAPIAISAANETADGIYSLTHVDGDINPTDDVVVKVTAPGYEVEDNEFEATL